MKLSDAKPKRLIEEATVDAYNESEKRVGFLTMIDENLALPFATQILGIEVSVERFAIRAQMRANTSILRI